MDGPGTGRFRLCHGGDGLTRFLSATVSLALWGAWILSVAIGLVAWAQAVATRQRLAWTLRSGAAFAGLWSVLMLVGAASGGGSALQPLAHLRGAMAAQTTAGIAYVEAKSVTDGDERRQLRVVRDINVREFLDRLDAAGVP